MGGFEQIQIAMCRWLRHARIPSYFGLVQYLPSAQGCQLHYPPKISQRVDIGDLPITLRQNGKVKQQARTSQMIYSVAEIISFASQSLTLMPGDLILTGTPSGVGPIHAGDKIEARIGEWPPLYNSVGLGR